MTSVTLCRASMRISVLRPTDIARRLKRPRPPTLFDTIEMPAAFGQTAGGGFGTSDAASAVATLARRLAAPSR
jgi:hypothetical protein